MLLSANFTKVLFKAALRREHARHIPGSIFQTKNRSSKFDECRNEEVLLHVGARCGKCVSWTKSFVRVFTRGSVRVDLVQKRP